MLKILVIDDEIDICEMIESFFSCRGYEVIYSVTGEGGLDAFDAEKPDVIILDICLNDNTSGLEILEKIRIRNKSCVVIIITGSALENDKRRAMELGADFYLDKPFSIEKLYNLLSKLK